MYKILIIVVFLPLIMCSSILLYKIALIQKLKREAYKIEAMACDLSNVISLKLQQNSVFCVTDVNTNPLLNKQGKGNWYCLVTQCDLQAQLQSRLMAKEQTKCSWFT